MRLITPKKVMEVKFGYLFGYVYVTENDGFIW